MIEPGTSGMSVSSKHWFERLSHLSVIMTKSMSATIMTMATDAPGMGCGTIFGAWTRTVQYGGGYRCAFYCTHSRICIKGDIRGSVERYGRRLEKVVSNVPSEDLEHLLQSMLRANPKQRLSLKEVIDHPWVTKKDSITTITKWTKSHQLQCGPSK